MNPQLLVEEISGIECSWGKLQWVPAHVLNRFATLCAPVNFSAMLKICDFPHYIAFHINHFFMVENDAKASLRCLREAVYHVLSQIVSTVSELSPLDTISLSDKCQTYCIADSEDVQFVENPNNNGASCCTVCEEEQEHYFEVNNRNLNVTTTCILYIVL